MTATTAGFTVTVRGRQVFLVDHEQGRDPGMSHHEAKELAQRLLHAAAMAERHLPEESNPFACPGCGEHDPDQQHALVGRGSASTAVAIAKRNSTNGCTSSTERSSRN